MLLNRSTVGGIALDAGFRTLTQTNSASSTGSSVVPIRSIGKALGAAATGTATKLSRFTKSFAASAGSVASSAQAKVFIVIKQAVSTGTSTVALFQKRVFTAVTTGVVGLVRALTKRFAYLASVTADRKASLLRTYLATAVGAAATGKLISLVKLAQAISAGFLGMLGLSSVPRIGEPDLHTTYVRGINRVSLAVANVRRSLVAEKIRAVVVAEKIRKVLIG